MNAILLMLLAALVLGFVAHFTKYAAAWEVVVFVILLLALAERLVK